MHIKFIRGTSEKENRLRDLGSLLYCGAKWLYGQANQLLISITDMDFVEYLIVLWAPGLVCV
jgi:hypothetical protein